MDYKFIFLVAVSSHLWYHEIAFKAISTDDSATLEGKSNEFSDIPNRDMTDLHPAQLGSYLEDDILISYNTTKLKNDLSSKGSRWPSGEVPFEISSDFTRSEFNIIAAVIDEYHNKTCVRFKHRTNENDYISITRQNSGCWSSVGRVGGKQQVNLQTVGCFEKPGTVIHELMHVLGFMHEQNRKERDYFVSIKFENVKKEAVINFQKDPTTDSFGVKYDYGSVMHYSPVAFSSNGQPTIVAKRRLDSRLMGQRDGFSSLDIKKINGMYNCKVNSKPKEPPIKLYNPVWLNFPFANNNPFRIFFGNIFNTR